MMHILFAALLLLPVPQSKPHRDGVFVHKGFGIGQDYLDMTQVERQGYAKGLVNGMMLSPLFGAPKDKTEWMERCVEGMSDSQVATVLFQYINTHPAEWHQDLHTLSYRAFVESCPNSPSRLTRK